MQVSANGVSWANPASNLANNWQFDEIRTYRFALYRNGIALFVSLQDGQKTKLDAQYSLKY